MSNSGFHRVYKDGIVPEQMRAREHLFLQQARMFWEALLKNRAVFFRFSVVNQGLDFPPRTEPITLRGIMADCLLQAAGMIENFRR